jgi:ABC-type multidrug transport system ATPase subunit
VGEDASDRTVEDLERIRVLSPAGPVPLPELAQFRLDAAMVREIRRQDGERQATIRFAFLDDDVDTPGKLEQKRVALEEALREIRLPEGTTLSYERSENDPILTRCMLLGAALILGVLAIAFESVILGCLILYTLPFGLVGMLWGLGITRVGMGPTALLGAIVLVGLINNNGILLVDRARELFDRGCPIGRAAMQAARDRTRPVLMTATTTMLGMLPMAIRTGGQNEIWPPFAISVIGGLAVGTVLTLVILPTGFVVASRLRVWLRETPVLWIGFSKLAWFALLWYLYFPGAWITSNFWRVLWIFCFFVPMALLTAILPWRLLRARRRRKAVEEGPPSVSIRNATKVYGRPGRIRRSIQTARRREARKAREGTPIVTRAAVLRSFLWKLPTLGVLLWSLLDYLESGWWLFWNVWAVWWMVRTLARDEFYLWGHAPRDTERGRFRGAWEGVRGQLVRIALLALAVLAVRHFSGLPWALTGILAGLLFVGSWVLHSGRLTREGLPLPQGRNPLSWLQRWMSGLVSDVPALGRKREEVVALRGASLELEPGLFGLLGPNGAGKTTMLRMVAGVLAPSRGSLLSCGAPPGTTDRSRAGYLPQDAGLYEGMTAREYVEYNALLLGHHDGEERKRLIERSLEAVGLEERMDDKLGGFSGGMKQRAGIARALLDLPDVLVVDEPTAGLDPVERVRFRNLLSRIARDRVVLFSTHVVEDVETACERLAVLEKGRIRYVGTTEEMREVARGKVWELDAHEGQIPGIRERGKIVRSTRSNGMYRLRVLAEEAPPGAVAVESSLEDAYLWLLREAPAAQEEEASDG